MDAERAVKEMKELKRKVSGLDTFLGSVHGEVMVWGRRVVTIETKQEEGRVRQENLGREAAGGWTAITGILPRITKLEAKVLEVDFRLTTAEEQNAWNDQKSRSIWMAVTANDPVEKNMRCNGVRTTWNSASDAFTRRFKVTPYVSKVPRHPDTGLIIESAATSTTLSIEAVDQPLVY